MSSFPGETFDEARDGARLGAQQDAVNGLMRDGEWRTLGEISSAIFGAPEASVSARLRCARKEKHGGYTVLRRYRGSGLWEYRYGQEERHELSE